MNSASKQIIFIVGPTAVGKSKIAIALAKKIKGEIVSADSMLIYKNMDIGTDKPSKSDLKGVKHHMINVTSPQNNYSVFSYFSAAKKSIADILKRKRIPIICGGTGLYIQTLLRGIDRLPSADLRLRSSLEKEAHDLGVNAVYERLQKMDAEAAKRIHPNNLKRVIRAIEVAKAKSDNVRHLRGVIEMGFKVSVFGVTADRLEVYDRINRRVDLMFKRGLLGECRKLFKTRLSETAKQAIGYKQVFAHIRGECELNEALEEVKLVTRHFAKRQWTWFRREPLIQWITIPSKNTPNSGVQQILALLEEGTSSLRNS